MTTPRNEMADLIRQVFRKRGWSIKRLADESGLPYASAHAFILATRDPTLSTAARMCRVLGLELRPVRGRQRKKG